MSKSRLQALALSLVVVASLAAGAISAAVVLGGPGASAPPATVADAARGSTGSAGTPDTAVAADATQAPSPIVQVTGSDLPDLPDVVERVIPSVVVVQSAAGGGTGIVIDRQGHVLTNFHVVEGADDLVVRLIDGTAGRAQVVGIDPGSDLAVIRASIQPQRLTPATFGDSATARVGESVFAIGNPFSQEFTVTAGIVSAVSRSTQSSFTGRPIRGLIQTDAALNPGNSGGPLFNAAGEVIGINASIENPNGRFSAGLGFAIPSNTALRFLPQLLAGEEIQHAQLGVRGDELNELRAEELGLGVERGVYIIAVTPGSAAARAGIRPADFDGQGGDVIVEIDGRPVRSFEDLALAIDARDVGDEVTVTVLRDGERLALSATLDPWNQ